MTGTALGANSGKSTRTITFKNEAHKKFYMEYLQKCRYQDVYHSIGILSRIKFRHKRSCGQNL